MKNLTIFDIVRPREEFVAYIRMSALMIIIFGYSFPKIEIDYFVYNAMTNIMPRIVWMCFCIFIGIISFVINGAQKKLYYYLILDMHLLFWFIVVILSLAANQETTMNCYVGVFICLFTSFIKRKANFIFERNYFTSDRIDNNPNKQ